jgi:hypothetical protein
MDEQQGLSLTKGLVVEDSLIDFNRRHDSACGLAMGYPTFRMAGYGAS